MHIGQTVKRIAPDGHETIFDINTYEQLEYLRDLEKKGYKYESVLTIHKADTSCSACEA